MAAIGSLVFCTDCGNLLDGSTGDRKAILRCGICGAKNRDTAETSITTRSKPTAFPSLLRQKRSTVQNLSEADVNREAEIDETCPDCGRKKMRYSTRQVRGADEGTTVFFSCECGHTHAMNN